LSFIRQHASQVTLYVYLLCYFIITYFLAFDEFPPLNTIVLVSLVEIINPYFCIIFCHLCTDFLNKASNSTVLTCWFSEKKGFYLFTFSVLCPHCIVCIPFWKDSNYVNIWKIFVSNQLQFMWCAHAHAQVFMHIHTYIHTHTHTHSLTSIATLCCAVKTVTLKSPPFVYLERLINEGTYSIENVGSFVIFLRQSVLNLLKTGTWKLKSLCSEKKADILTHETSCLI
jgi:hypothetical protein